MMTIDRLPRPGLSISVWILLYLLLYRSASAQPQTFEFSYGSSTCLEKGFRGVEPVDIQGGCPDGGYIAVGTSSEPLFVNGCEGCYAAPGTCDDNVYVVRTNANGTRIAEFVYDIIHGNGNGGYDEGVVIRELPDGFIIAGTTRPNIFGATSDIFLLKINRTGNVVFSRTYGVPGINDYASDLIVATTGNGTTTGPGDFVVAGWSEQPSPNMIDGLLMRTTSAGMMIWNRTYNILPTDPDQHDDYFHALVEDRTTGGCTGDIIAAGHTTSFSFMNSTYFGTQGLVVRVDGNNGTINALPQGAAHYGGAGRDERFNAVEQLTYSPESGNLVFAGSTTALGIEDIYLVKTMPDPSVMLVENTVDHVTGSGEIALGIIEVSTPGMPFCPIGDLAIVGRTSRTCPNPGPTVPARHDDALLLHVRSSTLAAVSGRHFGSQMGCVRNDVFYSIMDAGQSDPGFIMCGYTADNPAPIAPPPPIPDPLNLYLVKTDGNGVTGCAEEWNFTQQDPGWGMKPATAVTAIPLSSDPVTTIFYQKDHAENVCLLDELDDDIPPSGGSSIGSMRDGGLDASEVGHLLLLSSGQNASIVGEGKSNTGTIRAKAKAQE